jgi:hypothetical protein
MRSSRSRLSAASERRSPLAPPPTLARPAARLCAPPPPVAQPFHFTPQPPTQQTKQNNNTNKQNQRLLDGVSGVQTIDRFDVSDYPTRFAAQIKNFDDEG